MRVLLGNSAAKEAYTDGKGRLAHRDLEGSRVTTVHIPDSYTLMEAVQVVIAADGAWNHHSRGANVSDSQPDWVESDNDGLAQLLAQHFQCPNGRPKSWKDATETQAKAASIRSQVRDAVDKKDA